LYTIRSGKDKKDFFDLENLASPISNFSKGLSLKKKKKKKRKRDDRLKNSPNWNQVAQDESHIKPYHSPQVIIVVNVSTLKRAL
jgi:hypothetical protein